MNTIYKYFLLAMGTPMTAKDIRPKFVSECKTCKTAPTTDVKIRKGAVSSRIIDKDKNALIGATIQNLSAKNRGVIAFGVISDVNGHFAINAQAQDDIEISFVGLKTLRYKANQIPKLIIMQEDVQQIDDVVVVAPKKTEKVSVVPSLKNKVDNSSFWFWVAVFGLAGLAIWQTNKK
ncbi:hypothetical protein [Capnocytophaga catalasegens]|uniref:Carboxypeptidase regulatory-like domain-containing protein n=1 Tax=Capnocytophaga catalasegens TaxID=1004260 RepID=A0AAV5B117_9FLAO|nr:hypothetical protein [Capnocytophaga catalasegens]GIZ16583.1 hypothetical protein RCZ03_25830 [Capnocytophaga catalasegens]GJM51588.1 hypothetical protein RCZ15_25610 [Capnocytophaga catalasegens]GJM53700.1 hypothetical protein RCZ16_20160 [Capnocytophaga catalasegens]